MTMGGHGGQQKNQGAAIEVYTTQSVPMVCIRPDLDEKCTKQLNT